VNRDIPPADDEATLPGPRRRRHPRGRGEQRDAVPPASQPGGVTAECGCRYARTGGQWLHLTPCRSHMLRSDPVSDKEMRVVA
jgi:hypothetical protein